MWLPPQDGGGDVRRIVVCNSIHITGPSFHQESFFQIDKVSPENFPPPHYQVNPWKTPAKFTSLLHWLSSVDKWKTDVARK